MDGFSDPVAQRLEQAPYKGQTQVRLLVGLLGHISLDTNKVRDIISFTEKQEDLNENCVYHSECITSWYVSWNYRIQ